MSKKRHVCCLDHFFDVKDADKYCPCTGRCGFHSPRVRKGKRK